MFARSKNGMFLRKHAFLFQKWPKINETVKQKVAKAYSTRYSQAVTHPSTNRARSCLTSVIGRELVCSTRYGRKHLGLFLVPL